MKSIIQAFKDGAEVCISFAGFLSTMALVAALPFSVILAIGVSAWFWLAVPVVITALGFAIKFCATR